jgi:hypothetical protein
MYMTRLMDPEIEDPDVDGDDFAETSRALREIEAQMARDAPGVFGAPRAAEDRDEYGIEDEIDARLAFDGHVEGENMLQIFDAAGNNIIAGGWAGEQVFDVGTDGPNEGNNPLVFEVFSLRSTLVGAARLPVEDQHCAICRDRLLEGEDVRRLNCCHIFHSACIDRWLVRALKCPVCKHQFIPETDRLEDPLMHGKEADLVEAF